MGIVRVLVQVQLGWDDKGAKRSRGLYVQLGGLRCPDRDEDEELGDKESANVSDNHNHNHNHDHNHSTPLQAP